MPGLVGGFGNLKFYTIFFFMIYNSLLYYLRTKSDNIYKINLIPSLKIKKDKRIYSTFLHKPLFPKINSNQLGPYLAGLIEGDGTFAVHDIKSTINKYRPKIIIVFKKADLPLANYLCDLTQCGKVYIKPERGYVLWQNQDLLSVFKIICIINGYMRTPKHEALQRAIIWFNNYIINNKDSKLPSTKGIISTIYHLECKSLDNSSIDSNAWLAGFTDADGNFSINIHKRKNKNTTRVQPYFCIEVRQTYHRLNDKPFLIQQIQKDVNCSNKLENTDVFKISYYIIMSKLATYFNVNLYSRNRNLNDKIFSSFTLMATNQNSLNATINYFDKFPLISSKYLDYLDWSKIVKLKKVNALTSSYLDQAISIRKDFNKTRTTFTWKHLKNCYIS